MINPQQSPTMFKSPKLDEVNVLFKSHSKANCP